MIEPLPRKAALYRTRALHRDVGYLCGFELCG